MSLINTGLDSAISIAERRRGKLGSSIYSGRPFSVTMRNLYSLRSSSWMVVLSGFVEPVFYLLAMGVGLGQFIPNLTDGAGHLVSYAAYIAPALLATSAMNGAIYDSTWNVFFKMHFAKLYQGQLATSLGPLDVALGEIGYALLRGLAYAIGFMIVVGSMGYIPSIWGLLAIPAALLIAFAFASVGMGVTSYLTNFQQMNWINFFMLPMFLFSGTFFPLTVYPVWGQLLVQALPLWQATDMVRSLMLGVIGWGVLWHVLYFAVMTCLGLWFTTRRLSYLFQR
jgi:lipooligosaccharide transport system permease protein